MFIGGEKPGSDFLDLKTLPNVYFLGMKPNEDLPKYMANFDACLNLFASGDLSKDVSPLKFYEYLATGKPIVSTPQPDQILQFAPIIQVAGDEQAFIDACQEALSDKTEERKQARIEEGRKSSWDSRVQEICRSLEEKGLL